MLEVMIIAKHSRIEHAGLESESVAIATNYYVRYVQYIGWMCA